MMKNSSVVMQILQMNTPEVSGISQNEGFIYYFPFSLIHYI